MEVFVGQNDNAQVQIHCCYEGEVDLNGLFAGKKDETLLIPSIEAKVPHQLYVGLGLKRDSSANLLRNQLALAIKKVRPLHVKQVQVKAFDAGSVSRKEAFAAMAEGMNLTDFTCKPYKTGEDAPKEEVVTVWLGGNDPSEEEKAAVAEAVVLTSAMNMVKYYMMEAPNAIYPETLAKEAVKAGKQYGFAVEVMEESAIEALGMHAFLAVAKGCEHRPRLIVMRYLPNPGGKIHGIVGKGITVDTGGYCVKTSASMPYIKHDMSGAANAIAAISAIAGNHLSCNVVAVIASTENVIDGGSYKPGDVYTSMSGKTIEVLNTDAEGRLTLADALTYAIEKEQVCQVIDMATLTGQAGATFGSLYTPAFSNHEGFYKAFASAGKKCGEDFWRMPSDDRYQEYIKSDIADLKNTGAAGTIAAAAFLQNFAGDTPWIHLDIAATASQEPKVYEYAENMPSCVAVRTIYQVYKNENQDELFHPNRN